MFQVIRRTDGLRKALLDNGTSTGKLPAGVVDRSNVLALQLTAGPALPGRSAPHGG